MSKELKLDVMNNKNDLIEGTFCHSLLRGRSLMKSY